MRGWRYVRAMIDILLPRTCMVCGRKLNRHEKYLCLHCASDLPLTRFGLMSHNPMADKFNEAIQNGLEDSWRQEAYAFASALFFYEEESGYKHIVARALVNAPEEHYCNKHKSDLVTEIRYS